MIDENYIKATICLYSFKKEKKRKRKGMSMFRCMIDENYIEATICLYSFKKEWREEKEKGNEYVLYD
jgi:hypothetical protein